VIDWTECPPEQAGLDAAALSGVLDLVRAHKAAAQVCLLRDGQVILDRTFGCRQDSLFLTFSAGKPFVAVLVHLLAERGQLALDDPVARYWPEFGCRGKDAITIRQVLQHRSGIPVARGLRRDALAAPSWRRSVLAVQQARPSWPPGEVPAYHVLSFGFILGELVQRVTQADLRDVLRSELLVPLGLADTYLGLPAPLWTRHVPVRASGGNGRLRQAVFNLRAARQAVVPAATVSTTARDLARFYQMLLDGGELDGVRVLDPATVAGALQPSSDGQTDRLLGLPIRWSQGFQLGGPDPAPNAGAAPEPGPRPGSGRPRPMGRGSSPAAFGHNGSNCCIAWADPGRRLVFAYLTNLLQSGLEGSPHQSDVSDAVLATCARARPARP
jgi:CubicO group peptidase (beta-lactamase class C family)